MGWDVCQVYLAGDFGLSAGHTRAVSALMLFDTLVSCAHGSEME